MPFKKFNVRYAGELLLMGNSPQINYDVGQSFERFKSIFL